MTTKEFLEQNGLLYLKGFKFNQPKDFATFVRELIDVHLNKYPTYYVNNPYKLQTETGLHRSFGDIYLICRHYYPETSLPKLKKILCELATTYQIKGRICSDVSESTIKYTDEFGMRLTDFKFPKVFNEFIIAPATQQV